MASAPYNPGTEMRLTGADGKVYSFQIEADGSWRLQAVMGPPKITTPTVTTMTTTGSTIDTKALESLYLAMDKMKLPVETDDEPTEAEPIELERKFEPISDQVFRARLSSIMTDNKYDRKLKNRTRGKLDLTRLPKAKMASSSVFTQKLSRMGKNYNIVLLIDESGSMAGMEERTAGQVSQFLATHLDGLVNLAVVGFNHTTRVHKTFYQKPPTNLAEAVSDGVAGPDHGCNHDYEALEHSYQLLKTAPKGQSLVIYLTDGEPARNGSCGHRERDSAEVIRRMVGSHSEVTTIGVGIHHDPEQIDPKHKIVIEDLDQLKPQILNILRTTIKRG